jgi:hypothetical protein
MDKGKSSHAFSVENLVTLQEIANRNDTAIKDPNERIKDRHQREPGKPIQKQPYKVSLMTEASSMIGTPNNEQLIGYQELRTNMTMSRTSLCKN